MNRKQTFLSVILLFAMLLSACQSVATPAPAQPAEPTVAPQQTEAPAAAKPAFSGGKLEVFSWWTSGGEAAALEALFTGLKKLNPTVEIVNATVAGGGGSAARAVLQTRLAGKTPPDTWQIHSGYELLGQYVEPGYVEPLNDLYQSEGWDKVVPQGLIDQMSKDGKIYGVLAGVHRGNELWYNKKVLETAGVTIGASMSVDDFFAAAEKIKVAGVTPLCVGDNGIWASAELFENTLLGVIGPEKYASLWTGEVKFDDADVKKAMEVYGKMLDYQNSDHSALSWDQAIKKVMDGECAFSSMGDWAYGEFAKAGKKDNVDFGWVNHPGSDGSFMVVADGFVMAKNGPNPENNKLWLIALGSKEGQEAFNPLKGSIPARTDVDRAKFGAYHNWSMDSFAKDKLVGTVVHGSAAPADFQQALNDAVTQFIVDKNVDAFSQALVKAAQDAGFAK